MFLAPDQGPVSCGRGGCEWNRQQRQLLSHAEDKGAVRRGVARREGRCDRTDSALAGTLRPAPVDEGLDNDVGDEGSADVTHAASQSCLPTPCPTLNGERSGNAAPKQRLLNDTASTGKPGEKSCHVLRLLVGRRLLVRENRRGGERLRGVWRTRYLNAAL